jgi:aminopeptidase N
MTAPALLAAALVVAALLAGRAVAQAAPALGVPQELARERSARIADLRYDVVLSLPAARNAPIDGLSTLRFTLRDAARPLVLDFDVPRAHVLSVDANGRDAPIEHVAGHLVVAASALTVGENTLRIAYRAGDAPLNRGNAFLYTLFVPARARQALPVFDQPDLKARWTLTLEHPAAWQSVANGAEVERAAVGAQRVRVRFAETEPLPSYLFAFAAGEFAVETATLRGRTLRMLHRERDAAKLARNRAELFEQHVRSLEYLERYTAVPYPYGKFDFVLVPDLQYGGMEHAGAVLYRADDLLLDASAPPSERLDRARVIAHEVAHMWFGDLVTMRWFDDVWTKEVFAEFIAGKAVNPSFPDVNHDLLFALSNHAAAYEVDRSDGANPIGQPLANLDEAGSLYGPIVYAKSPVVMRQLEALLGEDNLRDGVRDYLRAHAHGNSSWRELIARLDPRTPLDLDAWSRVWVERPGRPTITTELELRDGRIARLAFRQHDARGRGLRWPQTLKVALALPDGTLHRFDVALTGEQVDLPAAVGLPAPRWVLPSAGGWAYGDFVLDGASLDALADALPTDALDRASAWLTLWDAVQEGRLDARRLLRLAFEALPRETDEQVLSTMLRHTRTLWWRWVSPAERRAAAPAFEALLRAGLSRAGSPGRKATWWRTLERTALSAPTLQWLRDVWARKASVEGMPLAETDEVRLALALAVHDAGDRDLLAMQIERTRDADRRARLAFVAPALSADAAERERWFASLADVERRRREVWVLEGLQALHHPLRASQATHLLAPGLRMLREIQRTGDIFFPAGWLQAMLDGHASGEAADAVRAFLQQLSPDYPPRLRDLVLQAADDLFRVTR